MTDANTDLKSIVRNWISNRIRSANDNYLASNDYVRFHQIEEASATSGVYSTILRDTDTSGQIEFVDTLDDGEVQADNMMKIVGLNMFNDAVDTLETSISSSNARIAELEQRLANLISAFESDTNTEQELIYTELLTELIDKMENNTAFTAREAIQLFNICSNIETLEIETEACDDLVNRDYGNVPINQSDTETKELIDLYDVVKQSVNYNFPFSAEYGRDVYNRVLAQSTKTSDMNAYIQKWEAITNEFRTAFTQRIPAWNTAIDNCAAVSLRDYTILDTISNNFPEGDNTVPEPYRTFYEKLENYTDLYLDTTDAETKMMSDLYDEVKGNYNQPFRFGSVNYIYRQKRSQYASGSDSLKKFIDTFEDMMNETAVIYVAAKYQ